MNRDLEHHSKSLLASEEWRTLPWRDFPKDSLQNLFDIGFEIAGLLEQLDARESSPFPENKVSKTAQISLRCSEVRDQLEEWYNKSSFNRDWQNQASPSSPGIDGDGSFSTPDFIDFWEATNMASCWLFKLILNGIMVSVVQDPPQLEQLHENSMRLALSILAASPHFLADQTGWLGPQRYFFPIRQAMVYLKQEDSPLGAKAQMMFGRTVGKLRAL